MSNRTSPTSNIEIPRTCLGPVLRAVTWVAKPEDWKTIETWAKTAGVDRVSTILAACEAELSEQPLSRGAWALYLTNPDPNRTGKSGVSPR